MERSEWRKMESKVAKHPFVFKDQFVLEVPCVDQKKRNRGFEKPVY